MTERRGIDDVVDFAGEARCLVQQRPVSEVDGAGRRRSSWSRNAARRGSGQGPGRLGGGGCQSGSPIKFTHHSISKHRHYQSVKQKARTAAVVDIHEEHRETVSGLLRDHHSDVRRHLVQPVATMHII